MAVSVGEWLAGDVREIKDLEYVTAPVGGYVCFARKGIVAIPCHNRTEAQVCRTEAEAIEYIERVHRRNTQKHAIRI